MKHHRDAVGNLVELSWLGLGPPPSALLQPSPNLHAPLTAKKVKSEVEIGHRGWLGGGPVSVALPAQGPGCSISRGGWVRRTHLQLQAGTFQDGHAMCVNTDKAQSNWKGGGSNSFQPTELED